MYMHMYIYVHICTVTYIYVHIRLSVYIFLYMYLKKGKVDWHGHIHLYNHICVNHHPFPCIKRIRTWQRRILRLLGAKAHRGPGAMCGFVMRYCCSCLPTLNVYPETNPHRLQAPGQKSREPSEREQRVQNKSQIIYTVSIYHQKKIWRVPMPM